MTQERTTILFFELFSGLPRQGPGDAASTLRALALVPGIGPESHVLDLGCGTGLQTRVLAQNSPARFVAVDNHPPFVDLLNREAQRLGIADRLEARVGDMQRLDFAPGSFDLIWCEGAISIMGVEAALRDWRRLLVPGGHMAVADINAENAQAVIEECGYETVNHFTLPPSSWWNDYYRPLQQNVMDFRNRHREEADAQQLADDVQREVDVWHAYAEFYGYEFFVMRTR